VKLGQAKKESGDPRAGAAGPAATRTAVGAEQAELERRRAGREKWSSSEEQIKSKGGRRKFLFQIFFPFFLSCFQNQFQM